MPTQPCPSHAHGSSSSAAIARAISDLRLVERRPEVVPALDGAPDQDPRLHAERLRVVGIAGDRAVEQRQRLAASLVGEPRGLEQRADDALPSIEVLRRLAARAGVLRGQQLRPDAADDAGGDLVLDGEDVVEVAVVALRP